MYYKTKRSQVIIEEGLVEVQNKGFTDPDFLFEYERELTCIVIGIKMIIDGSAPRSIENILSQLYPEKYIQSIFE